MAELPVNIDATYADSGTDASVQLHQSHHDALHKNFNGLVRSRKFNVRDYGADGTNASNEFGTAWDALMTDLVAIGGGEVYLAPNPDGSPARYVTARALQTTNNARAQLPLPYNLNTSRKIVVEIVGNDYGIQDAMSGQTFVAEGGAAIVSTLASQSASAGNPPALIGGPKAAQTGNGAFGFSNTMLRVHNVQFEQTATPSLYTVDARYLAQLDMDTCLIGSASLLAAAATSPGMTALGVAMPQENNMALCRIEKLWIGGMYCAVLLGEHTEVDYCALYQNMIALGFDSAGGQGRHVIRGGYVCDESNAYSLAGYSMTAGVTVPSGTAVIDIECLDLEDTTSGWNAAVAHFYVGGADLRGQVKVIPPVKGTTTSDTLHKQMTWYGGAGIRAEDITVPVINPIGASTDADVTGTILLDLDADSIVQADGSAVASWPALVGSAAAQATGANQPVVKNGVLNGHNTVRFAAASNQYVTSGSLALGSFTVFTVLNHTYGTSDQIVYEQGTNAGTGEGMWLDNNGTVNVHKSTNRSQKQLGAANNTGIPGGKTILCHTYDGTNAEHRVYANGRLMYVGASGGFTADPGTGATTAALNIGARSGGSLGWTGDIARLVVAGYWMNTTERRQWTLGLAAKYGIALNDTPAIAPAAPAQPFTPDQGIGYSKQINPTFDTPAAVTGTWAVLSAVSSQNVAIFLENTTHAQNDEINYDLVLPAGTYSIEFTYLKGAGYGIATVTIDDGNGTFSISPGTFDGYSASASNHNKTTMTGVVIPTTVKRRMKIKMATKNASSTNYFLDLEGIVFRRTA